MPLKYTVDDILSEIRSLLDEDDLESLNDDRDLLPSINRAQKYAYNILSRHYQEPLLDYQTMSVTSGTSEYSIPENIFEDKIEKIDVLYSGCYYECKRRSYRDSARLEASGNGAIPKYHVIYGRNIKLYPAPTAASSLRIWYLKEPDFLVKSQGRINIVNESSNYVVLDEVGDLLTTESDQLYSYVNVIDGQTGSIKCSLQIKTITDQRITFKSTPTRTTVLNKSISTTLVGLDVEADDYLCFIKGSCVPNLTDPISNFIIQYSTAEMKRKLGDDSALDQQILKDFETPVERSWAGRENTLRIKQGSQAWTGSRSSWFRQFYNN